MKGDNHEKETIEIWRYGINDYAVNFINGDCSVRGSLKDVIEEIINSFGNDIFEV